MIDLVRRGQSSVYGQVSDVVLKGNTWTNRAGVGDTSPQTVSNLDITKTYLLINDAGANVTIDTIDTPTPVKLTGDTEFDFVWASGKIALYELSAEETALDASVLGQKYHYVSDTKSTFSARVRSVGKNLFGGEHAADIIVSAVNNQTYAYKTVVDDRNCIALHGNSALLNKQILDNFKANTQYTFQTYVKGNGTKAGGYFGIQYTDGTNSYFADGLYATWTKVTFTSTNGKSIARLYLTYGSGAINYFDYDTIQTEPGPTAPPYEPYKESIVNVNLPEPLRSLPNGTKDELNVVTGVKTQRIGNKTNVASGTVINYADMATGGQFEVWGANGEYVVGVKGDTLAFTATSLTYQLSTPVVTQLEPIPITIFPNGTQYIEFGTKEVAEYADGIAITNTTIPIKTMVKVDKLHIEDGHWKRTNIPLTSVTVAGDGLSFTITGAVNGDTYEYSYDYDSALSTMPDLEVGEPSLVTRNNRTIVL